MDDDRFDRLARSLRSGVSRRAIGRVTLGGALGSAAGFPAWFGPRDAAAKCSALGKKCRKGSRCCGGGKCKGRTCVCKGDKEACGDRCANLLTDPANCGACGLSCADGQCVHGACLCDPFNNHCPNEVDGQCGCNAFVADEFQAACTDRNSACDLDKPCNSNADCAPRSVCLRGCSDPPDPQPNRCSKPCLPV
jgi:hypothetical protein